jgi:serine/threonine protein kinase
MPLSDSAVFAGFRIIGVLGSGGMGEVYLAQHPRLPRRDALKLLPRDVSALDSFRERFLREADLASTLWHPHIVGVHDRGEHDGQLWISMDFVDGQDAGRLLAQRHPFGMPQELVSTIITAVAAALDYAHKQGLLHRDVKPANIMLTHVDDEGDQRILLTDFGIARTVDEVSGLTATNTTVGTVAYSAPEQLMGEDIDGRADQYALAATAYHLLTGAPPFQHSNAAVVISRHLNTPPPALIDSRPELARLDPVLSAALDKDPARRFPRCIDFAQALAEQVAATGGAAFSAPASPAPVTRPAIPTTSRSEGGNPKQVAREKNPRRLLLPVAAASAVVLVLAAVALMTWRPWERRSSELASSSSSSATKVTPSAASIAPPVPPPPPPPPTFAASAIDTLMLSPSQIRSSTGGAFHGLSENEDMVVTNSSYGMSDNGSQVDPAKCVGVIFGADHAVYSGTGFEEIRDQTLDPSSYTIGNQIEQTAVVFPTAEQAQAVLTAQNQQWQRCADLPSSVPGTTGYRWDSVTAKVGTRGPWRMSVRRQM